MKKTVALILGICMMLALCGCAISEKAGTEATFEVLSEKETVSVHLYRDGETTLDLKVTDELQSLLSGDWEKVSGRAGGEKVLTLTVDTQHEITFFDNGKAMIYYGYVDVFEKDRCYYDVTLDGELDELYDWCCENGTVPAVEE
ncbi:MAG: hypothetical protein IJF69_05995 [Clostridia bacterium]|nr:hypothetical protein [Clostridia bacterium]